MAMSRGSGWHLVVSEDFKSFCRASPTSEVGSIPTRSRHCIQAMNISQKMFFRVIVARAEIHVTSLADILRGAWV